MIFNVNSGKGKDENLLPENIKNGVVIDDVVGTYSGEVHIHNLGNVNNQSTITVNNPYGTNFNGIALLQIGATANSSTSSIHVTKEPSGTYYCSRTYMSSTSPVWRHLSGQSWTNGDFISNLYDDPSVSVSNNSVSFYCVKGNSTLYFKGYYVVLIW